MSAATAGRNPRAVSPVEVFMRTPSRPSNTRFHFSTSTFVKHQKLATSSSKRPRPNGKMWVIGAVIVARGEKGGRKGARRIMKVNTVVSARRRERECWSAGVLERKFSDRE